MFMTGVLCTVCGAQVYFFSYFAIYYDAPSPGEIDTVLVCAEKRHTILRHTITAGVW